MVYANHYLQMDRWTEEAEILKPRTYSRYSFAEHLLDSRYNFVGEKHQPLPVLPLDCLKQHLARVRPTYLTSLVEFGGQLGLFFGFFLMS